MATLPTVGILVHRTLTACKKSLRYFWGLIFWMPCFGRARYPGPREPSGPPGARLSSSMLVDGFQEVIWRWSLKPSWHLFHTDIFVPGCHHSRGSSRGWCGKSLWCSFVASRDYHSLLCSTHSYPWVTEVLPTFLSSTDAKGLRMTPTSWR